MTFSDVTVSEECQYTIIRTWFAADICDNTASCTQRIRVVDTTAPSLTCPDDVTIECGDALPQAGGWTVTDNCDGSPSVTFETGPATGSCPMVVIRTYTATDNCGNSTECTQRITIEDTTEPTITCPDDITLECGDPIPVTTATANDICDDMVDITYSDGAIMGECPMVIVRTFVATDDCGLTSECTQRIVIFDTTPPVVSCPADVTVDCDASIDPAFTGVATAIDVCDPNPQVTILLEFPLFESPCSTVIQRVWTATDVCGNGSSSNVCSQTITIMDLTPPDILTCPEDVEIGCEGLTCLDFMSYTAGSVVTQVTQGGVTVDIQAWSKGGVMQDAVVFNTGNPPANCEDLGTPNTLYGGPGVNASDPDGYAASNNQSLGNVLIVQNPNTAPAPDDYFLSDSIVYEFSEPVFLESLKAIDFELEQIQTGAGVFVWTSDGGMTFFPMTLALGNDNSLEEMCILTAGVVRMAVYYGTIVPGSGGVADVCFVTSPRTLQASLQKTIATR